MEQNNIEEQEPVKEDEKEKMTLMDHIQLWGTLTGILLFAG
jgi:hypothetical protein